MALRWSCPRLLILGSALQLSGCGLGGGGVTPIRTPFNKGVYHYSRGSWDEAIAEFRLAVEDDPRDHQARFNLAAALEGKARIAEGKGGAEAPEALRNEAEAHYRLILETAPDDPRASVNLAALEYERGEGERGLTRLRALLVKHPRLVLPRAALAAHLLREARGGAGNRELLEEARGILLEALRRDPASVEANMLLGDACVLLGDGAQAREAYRQGLKREPSDIATLMALGRLEEKGDRAAALSWFRQVVAIDPDHAEAHQALARILEAEGDLEGALFHLLRARDLDRGASPASSEETRRRLIGLYRRLAEEEVRAGTPRG